MPDQDATPVEESTTVDGERVISLDEFHERIAAEKETKRFARDMAKDLAAEGRVSA